MIKSVSLSCLFVIILGSNFISNAIAAKQENIVLGDVHILVPSPYGYIGSANKQSLDDLEKDLVGEGSKLFITFNKASDLFKMATGKSVEVTSLAYGFADKRLLSTTFDSKMLSEVKKQLHSQLLNSMPKAFVGDANAKTLNPSLAVDQAAMGGIINDTENVFSYIDVTKINNKEIDLSSRTTLILKQRAITFIIETPYKSYTDYNKLASLTTDWIKDLQSANDPNKKSKKSSKDKPGNDLIKYDLSKKLAGKRYHEQGELLVHTTTNGYKLYHYRGESFFKQGWIVKDESGKKVKANMTLTKKLGSTIEICTAPGNAMGVCWIVPR